MNAGRIYIETFGCQMNELDSELVRGTLHALGYRFTPDPDRAQVVLYNTCSVREHAEQKVWSRLGELALRKAGEPGLVVGVLGCLAERDGPALIKRMPVVDLLCGPGELDKLPELLAGAVRARAALIAADAGLALDPARRSAGLVALQGNKSRRSGTLAAAADSLELLDLSRAVSPIDPDADRLRSSAYVRITRGCNKFCTYCVVPFTRGAEVHRPPDHIVDECKRLADAGVIEITLLGQTVNHYRFEHGAAVVVDGVTQPQKGRSHRGGHRRDPFSGPNVTTFAGLLARIHEQVPAIQRLRFVTSYPRDFGDDVLEVIRDHPRICRYLHVPVQSGSDRILGLMNRGYTVGEYLEFIDRARRFLDRPDLGRPLMLASDFIAGFPTETEEDVAATTALIRRARFKNSFIFKYSPRPGTTAFDRLPDDVPEALKRERNNRLLAVQAEISDQISREQVGRRFDVLVEGLSVREQKLRRRAAQREPGAAALTIAGRSIVRSEPSVLEQPVPSGPVQVSGRTEGDLIVLMDATDEAAASSMLGRVVRVQIESASSLALHGSIERPSR
jgi:tRNA-2-methylthio-N6-dimethylallyladenosine synthase